MSSLYFSNGASMIFLSENVSDSMSNVCPVSAAILSQCLCFMALFAINSSNGQLSLKSSIVFFKSWKACQSFKARGSLRQLEKMQRIKRTHHELKMFLHAALVTFVITNFLLRLFTILLITLSCQERKPRAVSYLSYF